MPDINTDQDFIVTLSGELVHEPCGVVVTTSWNLTLAELNDAAAVHRAYACKRLR